MGTHRHFSMQVYSHASPAEMVGVSANPKDDGAIAAAVYDVVVVVLVVHA